MSITHNAIRCAICQHLQFSTLIDPKEQSEELIGKLGRHLEARHKEDLSRNSLATKQLGGLVLIYVFLHNMAVIPEDNVNLTEYINEAQDEILKYLGFDEQDEDDEEIEDDTDIAVSVLEDIRDKTEDSVTRGRLTDFITQYMKPPVDEPTENA